MYKKYIKRILDIIISALLIIILFPFFIITYLLVKVSLGSPVIFKQKREGLYKKPYVMYKFRVMDFNYDAKREERMNKVGKFLDICKLNELPQLFNVLKGDMSLVGPRPFIPGDALPTIPPKERYSVRPGMTGLAQVNGGIFISHNKKIEYDLIYANNVSFWLDLKILVKTPFKIIYDYALIAVSRIRKSLHKNKKS